MPVSMNLKLTIEYDGTDYHGWQVQPHGRTIQEILELALGEILRERVRLRASGRTDAGVHAAGQVANFTTSRPVELWRLQRGVNALTPPDIVVREVEQVPESFDARRNARSRLYEYRIWNQPWPSALQRRFSFHVHAPLELAAMKEAIAFLEGEHDFSSFRAAGCDAAHPVRKIYNNTLLREGDLVVYRIEANAFLRHMVRNLVGTLLEVGCGERTPARFSDLLKARDRTLAGPTAPPRGLFLKEVKY